MEHYFSSKPVSDSNEKEIHYFFRENFTFITSSSVFSKDRIDRGSEILIKNCIIHDNDFILDLGCGYGPVGTVIGKLNPNTRVLMTDVNERAVYLSKKNLELNKVKNAETRVSSIYSTINQKFDTILSNPPQSAGKKVCMEMIEKAKDHLKENGRLQVVARHNKGGKEFLKKMNEIFGNAETIAKESGYHVYLSVNR